MSAKAMQPFRTQTALELLNNVRYGTDPPGLSFIDGFDEHIVESLPFSVSEDSTLNRGDVIEIQGGSGSGKTTLLYFLAMTCVLPYTASITVKSSTDIVFSGRGKSVIVCDCDGKWSSERLHGMLFTYILGRVRQALSMTFEIAMSDHDILRLMNPSVHSLCRDSLNRLHVFQPTSSLSLAATLDALPAYHSKHMGEQEICMLMVDSVSAYHWPDLWKVEQTVHALPRSPIVAPDGRPLPDIPPDIPMAHIIKSVDTLRSRLGIITIFTNWTLSPPARSSRPTHRVNPNLSPLASEYYSRQHLSPPFPSPFVKADSSSISSTRRTIPESPFQITHHITLVLNQPFLKDFCPPNDAQQRNELPFGDAPTYIKAYVRTPFRETPEHPSSFPPSSLASIITNPSAPSNQRGVPPDRTRTRVSEGTFEFGIRAEGLIWF